MPLKNDWQNGDLFTPAAANDMANVVNAFGPPTATGQAVVTAASAAAARTTLGAANRAQVYYAKDHGVIADGTTNDLTALNSLITTVSTAGGGVVLLPIGTVKVNGQVAMAANVTLRGHGWQSVILLGATAADAGVVNIGAGDNNVVIEDLKIDANRAAFTTEINSGIWGSGGGYENILVRNVWVTGPTYNGITFLGSSTRASLSRNIRIVDCLVTNCGYSPILIQDGVDQCWIDRCTVRDYGKGPTAGVGITVGRFAYDCQITNCVIDGTDNPHAEAHGISLDTPYGKTNCSGNTIINCEGYGIEVGHVVNGSVCNNTIIGGARNAIALTSTLLASATSIRSNVGVTIAGNTIDGTDGSGIAVVYNNSTSGQDCPASATLARSTAYTAAVTNRVLDGRRLYECTTSGTTAASKPAAFGTSATGDTITDGTSVWTDRGNTNAQIAIAGNVIRNVGEVGVYLNYCHLVAVTGNVITDTGLSGIKAEATANMYSISANEIQGCNSTASAGHGGLVMVGYTGAPHVVKSSNNRVGNSGVINMQAVDSLTSARIDDRFLANSTTPTVAFGGVFVTQNTGATTITALSNANSVEGRTVTVRVNDAFTTFQHSSSGTNTMRLLGAVNFAAPSGTDVTFSWEKRTTQWIEVARSTGLPLASVASSTSTALGVGSLELGHASDTTLTRSTAGRVAVEGVDLVTLSAAQTMTNKTLTSPKVDALYDTGGAPAIALAATASGVNYLTVTGSAAAGASTSISATGTDSSVAVNVFTKGTGAINMRSSTNGVVLQALPVASGVNYVQVSNATTGNPAKVSAVGSDASIGINLVPKGAGQVQIDGNTASARVSVPASATSAGKPGQWSADSSYIYKYIGDGTTHSWVRAAAAAW